MNEPQDIIFDKEYRVRRDTKLVFRAIFDRIIIQWMLLQNFFIGIYRVFVPKKVKSIADKIALITGGGNGIGKTIAIKLAQKGCHLVIADVDYQAATRTVEEITNKFKVKAMAYKCDVSNHDEVMEMKIYVEKTFGYVDLLINNAGVLGMDVSLREKKPENIMNVINVNLMSNFWTIRAFLDTMVERKSGHIIAICSMAGKITIPNSVAYCTSKHAVTGLMSALFDELCALGQDKFIKTTTIYPCMVATRKDLLEVLGDVPIYSPEEVAEATVKGIIDEERNVYVPKISKLALIVNTYPDNVVKYIKLKRNNNKIVEMRKNGLA